MISCKMKNLPLLNSLLFPVRNVESPGDVKKANACLKTGWGAEGQVAVEDLKKADAYSLLEINNGTNH